MAPRKNTQTKNKRNTQKKAAPKEDQEKNGPNALTRDSGLKLNVNRCNKAIKTYFTEVLERKELRKITKTDKETKKKTVIEKECCSVQIASGADVLLSAFLQKLSFSIIEHSSKQTQYDKSDLLRIYRQTMKMGIDSDRELQDYFMRYIMKYSPTISVDFHVTRKEIDAVAEEVDPNIVLTGKAYSFLRYLLEAAYKNIITTALEILDHQNRKKLNAEMIECAIKIAFEGHIRRNLLDFARESYRKVFGRELGEKISQKKGTTKKSTGKKAKNEEKIDEDYEEDYDAEYEEGEGEEGEGEGEEEGEEYEEEYAEEEEVEAEPPKRSTRKRNTRNRT